MLNCDEVIQGECVEVLKGLPDSSVDFLLTDPPYMGSYKDGDGRTLANDRNPEAVVAAYPELFRVLKPDSFCVTFYGHPKLGAFVHAWAQSGFDVMGHIVWPIPCVSSAGRDGRKSARIVSFTTAPWEQLPAPRVARTLWPTPLPYQ
jgi:DNA modification methylase